MVSRESRALALYRLRVTWGRRLGGYLTIVVLVTAIGGLALGSVAAARRTQSSYPILVASTHPSSFFVATALDSPGVGNGKGYDGAIVDEIARLPHVKAVVNQPGLNVEALQPDGAPIVNNSYMRLGGGSSLGSLGGEAFTTDRFIITRGHLPDPADPDEFMTNTETAAAYGWRVGEVVRLGFYSNAQTASSEFGSAKLTPDRTIEMKLTGVGEPVTNFIRDDIDFEEALGFFTPALTEEVLACCANYTETGVVVDSPSHIGLVEKEIVKAAPKGFPVDITAGASANIAKAERALKPISIALGVFGGIAGLALLLIIGQIVGRQLRLQSEERSVLRALGASPSMTTADALVGVVTSIALGAVLAVGVAVALSALAPLGPLRSVYPDRGISFDWTVLGLGFASMVVVFVAVACWLAYLNSPERAQTLGRGEAERPSLAARLAAAIRLPASATVGLRFALEPGSGRRAVPVRSAILGAALATIVLITTVTFGASLDHLVATPSLYGWNWDYALSAGDGGGGGDVPAAAAVRLLNHDRYVSTFSGVYTAALGIDGVVVQTMAERPGAALQPPTLHGSRLLRGNQIVLGPLTLAQLHKHVGSEVTVETGVAGYPPRRLRIVGVATMPTLGSSGGAHLDMGTGALVSSAIFPPFIRNPFNDPETGPSLYLVDVRPGANPTAARRSLEAMTGPLSNSSNFGVVLQRVLRPAEIVNYRSVGTTPAILGSALGLGAVAALGMTLLASVRRRRRDLALLKTLGFTRRQLAGAVAWQSNVAVIIGTAVGVPLGIAVGSWLWDLFTRQIYAVPLAVVPGLAIALIALGALVLANVVSFVPGRIASRTPTALLLRAE